MLTNSGTATQLNSMLKMNACAMHPYMNAMHLYICI